MPSQRHKTLVADFARRLAARLGLPLVDCIHKTRATEPQKTRENSFQQLRNLEHAFTVDGHAVPPGPALLVDDMVDSRWTLTVLAFKLRRADAGQVFPFALADSSADDGNSP